MRYSELNGRTLVEAEDVAQLGRETVAPQVFVEAVRDRDSWLAHVARCNSKAGTSRKVLTAKDETPVCLTLSVRAYGLRYTTFPPTIVIATCICSIRLSAQRQDVFGQHDEIGQLARLDRALRLLFERQVRVVDRLDLSASFGVIF